MNTFEYRDYAVTLTSVDFAMPEEWGFSIRRQEDSEASLAYGSVSVSGSRCRSRSQVDRRAPRMNAYGNAICPTCGTSWRQRRNNRAAIVAL